MGDVPEVDTVAGDYVQSSDNQEYTLKCREMFTNLTHLNNKCLLNNTKIH